MADDLPVAADAERQTIGLILIGGVEALDLVREQGLRPAHFYEPRYEAVMHACERLAAEGRVLDPTTLRAALLPAEKRAIGHPNALLDMVTGVTASIGHLGYYATMVTDAWTLRQIVDAGLRISQLGASAPLDRRREALERARAMLDGIDVTEERESLAAVEDLLPEVLDTMEDGKPRGVSTGIAELDEVFGGGMGPGQSIIVGARPSIGKSMLGCNLAAVAASAGVPTIIFSHEMTRHELTQRLLARESGVPLSRIRNGQVAEGDWERVARATARISSWPLLIDDESSMTVADYRARLRKITRRRRVGLVVSDYLQLIKPMDGRIPRQEQVTQTSAGIKALAKDYEVPVLTLAQLSRATEQRRDSRPILSDLRESGSIENDADIVMLMHQTEDEEMELNVAKNRQGERRIMRLSWLPAIMRCASI